MDEDFKKIMAEQGVHPLAPNDRIEPYRRKKRGKKNKLKLPVEDEWVEDCNAETPLFLEYRQPGVRIRQFQDLKRGLIPPQDRLDLHGLRVEEAKRALSQFFQSSLNRRLHCVHIIHGKGLRSQKPPVLKQRLNQWLPQKKEVLAFCSAPRWDGGTGAIYVLLKRNI